MVENNARPFVNTSKLNYIRVGGSNGICVSIAVSPPNIKKYKRT